MGRGRVEEAHEEVVEVADELGGDDKERPVWGKKLQAVMTEDEDATR